MAAESGVDFHDGAPRCLLGLFDAASGGLADWSELDAEAERLSIEVRGLSREGLAALIESSTLEIPTTEHRRLHQEASDFVRWGRRGGLMLDPWPSTASIGRYAGYGAQSQRALGGPARSCSGACGAGGNGQRVPSP